MKSGIAVAAIGAIGLFFADSAGAQDSTADVFVGAGMFRTDDFSLATGDVGMNVWLIRRLGVGVRHSVQVGRIYEEPVRAHLSVVTVNFRHELTARSYLQAGWIPLMHSVVDDAFGVSSSWGGGAYPLFDVFVNVATPYQGFRVQGGVNLFVGEGGWIHPLVLGVFSFPR